MSAQLQPGGAPTAAGDPSQGATTGDPSTDQGFTVCISSMPDGTFSVYAQDADDDQDDAGASGGAATGSADDSGTASASGGDEGAQTADNVDDALALAKQMLEQEAGEDDSSGDANAMMSPADAKSAWNAMAAKRDKKRMGS